MATISAPFLLLPSIYGRKDVSERFWRAINWVFSWFRRPLRACWQHENPKNFLLRGGLSAPLLETPPAEKIFRARARRKKVNFFRRKYVEEHTGLSLTCSWGPMCQESVQSFTSYTFFDTLHDVRYLSKLWYSWRVHVFRGLLAAVPVTTKWALLNPWKSLNQMAAISNLRIKCSLEVLFCFIINVLLDRKKKRYYTTISIWN